MYRLLPPPMLISIQSMQYLIEEHFHDLAVVRRDVVYSFGLGVGCADVADKVEYFHGVIMPQSA